MGKRIRSELSRTVLLAVAMIAPAARAQFSTTGQDVAQQTRARGYWADPATGLRWTAKDSNNRMGWRRATRYCRNLRVAGYSGWRLPSIDELHGLVNLAAYTTERIGSSVTVRWNGELQVNGGLMLCGDRYWSKTPVEPAAKRPAKFWEFNFRTGRTREGFEDLLEGDTLHALCVRDP